MSRKIAIVGTAPSSCAEAPYDDPTWEIWTLGTNREARRFTRWFELHTVDVLIAAGGINQQREEFLRRIGKDCVIGHASPLFPDATIYPKDEIVATFGNYFTSSVAWMLALAIHEGATEIGLWGVDMVGECEYNYQRAGCEYFLGIARGRGIEVTISPHSPLLRAERLYAFEHTGLSAELQIRISELSRLERERDADFLKALEERSFARGALAHMREIERRWG